MCGICGILDLSGAPIDPRTLQAMNGSLAHRGPDDEGVWIEGSVGLGHRRLSIIDLSPTGHQPMRTADGRITMVFNGEVYNFPRIRAGLESEGVRFKGT